MPPPLALFRKFIRFGSRTLPLIYQPKLTIICSLANMISLDKVSPFDCSFLSFRCYPWRHLAEQKIFWNAADPTDPYLTHFSQQQFSACPTPIWDQTLRFGFRCKFTLTKPLNTSRFQVFDIQRNILILKHSSEEFYARVVRVPQILYLK